MRWFGDDGVAGGQRVFLAAEPTVGWDLSLGGQGGSRGPRGVKGGKIFCGRGRNSNGQFMIVYKHIFSLFF